MRRGPWHGSKPWVFIRRGAGKLRKEGCDGLESAGDGLAARARAVGLRATSEAEACAAYVKQRFAVRVHGAGVVCE